MVEMRTEPTQRHARTWLTLEETRPDRRFCMPYLKTYDFDAAFIDEAQTALAHAPTKLGMIDIGIAGWLLPADACKLYEMAYYCGGDCLELGTFRGLSASVLLGASAAAGLDNIVVSIDLDPGAPGAARGVLAGRPGAERARFFSTDGEEALAAFARHGRKFRFCFVDHSHTYLHVRSACRLLPEVIVRGGFCLFHDFNDPRNADDGNRDYGVWQGVRDGLDPAAFEFWGIFGCTGLFRRI